MISAYRLSSLAAFLLLSRLCAPPDAFGADQKARGTVAKAASPASSAVAGLHAPILGYVSHSSPLELRPIVGIPGAVLLGDPIRLPVGVRALAVAPGQVYAVAQVGDQGETDLLPFTSAGLGGLVPIPGALAAPDRMEFNPAASVVALYSAAGQTIQVIGGLPAAPHVLRSVDVSGLGAPAGAFAISDDGQALLVAAAAGDNSVLTLFPAGGDASTVTRAGAISAVRFFPGTQDALVADRQWNQILLWSAAGGPRVIAGAADGVAAPVDVQSAASGRRVLVANQGNKTLLDINLDATTVTSVACSFSPAGLRMLRQKSAFLVMDADHGGAWTVDTGAARESVSYVPRLYHPESKDQ